MPSIPSHCSCGAGKAPRPISGRGDREAVGGAELAQLLGGVGVDHAAAGVDHRPPRVGERLGGDPDLLDVALGRGLVAGQVRPARCAARSRCRPARGPAGCRPGPGPGRPVEAMWKASWMYSGIWRGSVTRKECLTIGIVMPMMSASWKPSVPISSVRTWPVMKTVGTESIIASAIAVTRLVAPGPGGGERDADPAGGLRVALGRVAARPARGGPGCGGGRRRRARRRSAGWPRRGCRRCARRPRP